VITRPFYDSVSVADAMFRDWRGWSLSEKMDGVWTVRSFADSTVTGETVKGVFHGFDIVVHDSQDMRRCAWLDRGAALTDCAARYGFRIVKQGAGAEFIEAVLRDGGEGVVCKPWTAPFGASWIKVKRLETFDCVVTAIDYGRGSLRLAMAGEDCGWCLARSAHMGVRVGDVVEVAAACRHTSGKFREPRFFRIRTDKMGVKL